MFALTQDLPQRSHIKWNLSVTNHLSRRVFVLDEIFSVLFIWLFFFQYFFSFWPVHFSSYLATWPFLSWERICIGMMAGVKTEEKRLRKCIDFMTRGSFCIRRSLQVVAPIRISLSVYGITGLYLIILNFLAILSFSFYFIFAWTHGQLLDLYVWNRERYEIIHFFSCEA